MSDMKIYKNIYSNQGIAILMVMSAIAILSFLLIEFTFDVKVNKLRIYNQQDKIQAKLNAEAGIKFSLAKLRLYQEARNLLEKNEQLKTSVGERPIESIVTQPFIFPIPDALMANANLIQKNAIQDFLNEIVLQGTLSVNLSSVSGFLNPNNLRISLREDDEEEDFDSEEKKPHDYIQKEFVDTLTKEIDKKIEEDDLFANTYSNIDPEILIKELKFFVNDIDSYDEPEVADFQSLYDEDGTVPKYAPLTSISEMHLLKGWDDNIINLIKDRLTVHEVSIIPVNEINNSQLKLLFPEITEDQITDFFNFRDGNEKENIVASEFLSVDDFKNAIINNLAITDEITYNNRITEFKNAGIQIGVAGKLFKAVSVGTFGRATYKITAYIDMPIKPDPPKKKEEEPEVTEDLNKEEGSENKEEEEEEKEEPEEEKEEKKVPTEFLEPRIVELIVGE
ncbi:MAG: hypothetical protein HOJ35_10425 [Bdellovibrionales bacterium]|nr:hypothetical protein [Bdellovibrionales bacterium]